MSTANLIKPYTGKPDKKRLRAALKREKVDRVPNCENLIEDRHVEKILGKYAGNTLSYGGDPAKGAGNESIRPMYADDFIDLANIIGQDVISFEGGFWTPFTKEDDEGRTVQVSDKSVKSRKDFDSLGIDSQKQISNSVKYLKEYKEALKRRGSELGTMVTYGCMMQTLYEFVIGMNDFMMLCYEDPKLIDDMLEVSTVHFARMTEALVGEGVDFIFLGDDVAFKTGLFLPPAMMQKIWVPRVARIIGPALDADVPILFHSDGKIDDIVEDLITIGVDCINPMDPYGVDYRDYKKRFGKRVCLSGNIDIEFPLSKGTPEDVEKDVREHMEVLKQGNGYIAASSHSIVNYIPHENYIAYINAIHKYGII
jgi:uroporphyrinogen decarboxylase